MRVRRATLVVVLTSLRSKANEHVSFLGKELSLGIYFVSILFRMALQRTLLLGAHL